jgi:hypothetical protein
MGNGLIGKWRWMIHRSQSLLDDIVYIVYLLGSPIRRIAIIANLHADLTPKITVLN